MLEEVDVVHCLGQVDESPAVETDVFGRLKLVIQAQQSLEGVVVRGTLSDLVRKLEPL